MHFLCHRSCRPINFICLFSYEVTEDGLELTEIGRILTICASIWTPSGSKVNHRFVVEGQNQLRANTLLLTPAYGRQA